MIKMQVACLVIVLFVAIIYFSGKRKWDYLDKIFSLLVLMGVINLVFDMITVYTVNHLDKVNSIVNLVCHQIFIGSLLLVLFFVFIYLYVWLEYRKEKKPKISKLCYLPLILFMGGLLFGKMDYRITTKGNYAYGSAASVCYFSVGIYILLIVIFVIKDRKLLDSKTISITVFVLGVEVIVSAYQLIVPTSLLSGLGTTLLVLGFFLIAENPDIDTAKEYALARDQADAANEAKSSFLAQMSHEIRTPLNAVMGMDEMILRESQDEEILEYAETIQKAGGTLLSLINDILDISKIESGKMELLCGEYMLSSLLNDLVALVSFHAKSKDLLFVPKIDENIPDLLYGDEVRIRQIIVNLLNNAVKYTDNGTITLEVKLFEKVEDEVVLHVSVVDTGIGIKPEDIPRIFESYRRVAEKGVHKIEGTGLGMNITQFFLNAMGSELQVESTYNEGSCFSFFLRQKVVDDKPIGQFGAHYAAAKRKENAYREAFIAPSAKILLVDDDEMNRKVFRGLLRNTKVSIMDADCGMSCLDKAAKDHYDIIFMDHMMPDMDGIETMRQLRKRDNLCHDTPIVILTANAVFGAREKYLSEGFERYLSKPVNGKKLEQTIQDLLPPGKIMEPEPLEEDSNTYGFDESIMKEIREDFYYMINDKQRVLTNCIDHINADENQKRFILEVHSLKSSALIVNEVEMSQKAEELEKLGYENRFDEIVRKTPELLALLYRYKENNKIQV